MTQLTIAKNRPPHQFGAGAPQEVRIKPFDPTGAGKPVNARVIVTFSDGTTDTQTLIPSSGAGHPFQKIGQTVASIDNRGPAPIEVNY